jgi:hypothetical protein
MMRPAVGSACGLASDAGQRRVRHASGGRSWFDSLAGLLFGSGPVAGDREARCPQEGGSGFRVRVDSA